MPITDAQLALLRAALLRDDGLLPRPDRLAGAALSKVGAALTGAGLAEPVPVPPGQPRWRDIEGVPTGLRITDTGRAAAGAQPTTAADDAAADDALPEADAEDTAREPDADAQAEPAAARPHRSGSKAARLVAMLSEVEGATVGTLSAALSWQPHTVRAALTRLRQGGFSVTASKGAGQPTTYRIVPAAQTVPAPADVGEAR